MEIIKNFESKVNHEIPLISKEFFGILGTFVEFNSK
jgi:hypothetical protein